MAKRWVCVFEGRAGLYARAEFETREEAVQCAERHSCAIMPSDVPPEWDGAEEAAVATTQLGDYRVELIVEPTGSGIALVRQPHFERKEVSR